MNEQTYAKWLTDLGPLGLTFALVIAIGYLIRLVPWVANRYIPLLAPVVGGVLLPLIAPTGFIADTWKNPTVVLVIYGIIVGVVAWAAHALIISRIEELLSSKFPAVGKFFAATADPQPVKPEGRGLNSKPDGLPPFPLWILAALLAGALLLTPGCALTNPKSPVTFEATRYLSFKDTWTVALTLYDSHMDRRAAGKVSAKDAADIDAAWNTFRAAYDVALDAAKGDKTSFTPDNVKKLANDVLVLIYAAQ